MQAQDCMKVNGISFTRRGDHRTPITAVIDKVIAPPVMSHARDRRRVCVVEPLTPVIKGRDLPSDLVPTYHARDGLRKSIPKFITPVIPPRLGIWIHSGHHGFHHAHDG